MNTPVVERYLSLLHRLCNLRTRSTAEEEEEEENATLDEMDVCWDAMSDAERAEAETAYEERRVAHAQIASPHAT